MATGERLYTLSEPLDGLNTIALDPTGNEVAAGGLDKTIRIWSLGDKGGTLVNSLIAHEDAILKLAWSPDGKLLASSVRRQDHQDFQGGRSDRDQDARQPAGLGACRWSLRRTARRFAAGRYDGSLEIYSAGQLSRVRRRAHGANAIH